MPSRYERALERVEALTEARDQLPNSPLKAPQGAHAGSYFPGRSGMLWFDYDEESDTLIVFDVGGYVGTAITPQTLWEALKIHATGKNNALRDVTRVRLHHSDSHYLTSKEKEQLQRAAEAMVKAKAQEDTAQTPNETLLEDLGL